MNKLCSIFIDNNGPINEKVLAYLEQKYSSIILIGNQITSRYHTSLPYLYYNYIRYNYDIDIIFQNLNDIPKLGITQHKLGYIYDCSKHNYDYNELANLFSKIEMLVVSDSSIPKQLFKDTFQYSKEVLYV